MATTNVTRRTPGAFPWYAALVAAALCFAPANAIGFDVTSCNTFIDVGETGVLTGDLSCTNTSYAVGIDHGGTLDLNGFTISHDAQPAQFSSTYPIWCRGWCNVISSAAAPGRIVGAGHTNTVAISLDSSRVRVENVEIEDFAYGIRARFPSTVDPRIRVQLRDVVFRDLLHDGTYAVQRVKGQNVTVAGTTQTGFFAYGLVKLTGLTCIDGARRCVTTASGVRVIDSLVSTATEYALYGNRVAVIDGIATGSVVDIASYKKPKLRNSTCDVSKDLTVTGTNWGVCTLD